MIPLSTSSTSRLSRFTPKALPGLQLWLDASRISGLADNDAITTWSDLSGNGRDATSSGTTRPLYKTNIRNGRAATLWQSGDDRMSIASHAISNLFVVAMYNASTFDNYDGLWMSQTDIGGNGNYFRGNGGSNNWFSYGNERGSLTARMDGTTYTGSAAVTNAWHVFDMSDTTDNTQAWRLGQDTTFGDRGWNGYIAEVITCSGVLTSTMRDLTRKYLGTKWLVTVT